MSKLIIKSAASPFVPALVLFGDRRRQVSGPEVSQELPRKLLPTSAKESRRRGRRKPRFTRALCVLPQEQRRAVREEVRRNVNDTGGPIGVDMGRATCQRASGLESRMSVRRPVGFPSAIVTQSVVAIVELGEVVEIERVDVREPVTICRGLSRIDEVDAHGWSQIRSSTAVEAKHVMVQRRVTFASFQNAGHGCPSQMVH